MGLPRSEARGNWCTGYPAPGSAFVIGRGAPCARMFKNRRSFIMLISKHWSQGLRALLVAGLVVTMHISTAAAQSPVKLTFWNGFTGPDRPGDEALVPQFNDAHPNIQVEMSISPW